MIRRGFTIVELVIVITIMSILLTLGVVNMRSSQVNGRDAERKIDIESITSHLESYYNGGNFSGTSTSIVTSTYPSTAHMLNFGVIETTLRDIDIKSATAPGAVGGEGSSLVIAEGDAILTSADPHPYTYEYVYQPLKTDGSLCTGLTDECVKYNLYYRLEADNSVSYVKSKNQ